MAPHRDSPLLISEPPLQVLPSLAVLIGLNEAMFLQQLHYWLGVAGKERDGRLWVWNTYEDWHKQFPFWGIRTIKRIVANLQERKLILTTAQYNKMPMDLTCPPKTGPVHMLGLDGQGGRQNATQTLFPGRNHPQTTRS